jgi:hypothetical protein
VRALVLKTRGWSKAGRGSIPPPSSKIKVRWLSRYMALPS